MIPQYQRLGGSSSGSGVFSRRSFRTREKCLILLVFVTFCFVCFGGFFYLPDDFGTDKVLRVYKQFQKAGPEIFIPAPPVAGHHGTGGFDDEDPHVAGDRAKLNAKIREEFGDNLEKPDTNRQTHPADAPIMNAPSVEHQLPESPHEIEQPMKFNLPNGEDRDPVARERRNKVKEVSPFTIHFLKIMQLEKKEIQINLGIKTCDNSYHKN